jgi:hypothetical protein
MLLAGRGEQMREEIVDIGDFTGPHLFNWVRRRFFEEGIVVVELASA